MKYFSLVFSAPRSAVSLSFSTGNDAAGSPEAFDDCLDSCPCESTWPDSGFADEGVLPLRNLHTSLTP